MKEADIQREALRLANLYLRNSGGRLWRANAGRAMRGGRTIVGAPRGTADLIGWRPVAIEAATVDGCSTVQHARVVVAQFVGCEVKRPGQALTAAQERWRDALRADGGLAFRLDDPDQIVPILAGAWP